MAVNWQLKTYLAKHHGVYRPTDLQKRIVEKTKILISLSNLTKLLGQKPTLVKLETMELICTAFDCCLSDFCQVKASLQKLPTDTRKLSYKNATKKGETDFPDPKDYE